ncbi:MAG: 3-phosphoshikimate 1-carboxyvinyltransferase, partial [Planctomycetes bacterium]|nr:3-phosphoshikimate 1-carboxyvinyltransferase [Planctomycetota bacterium]
MKLIASKSTLGGTVSIPGSKSHTIRGIAIASLAEGESIIRNPLISSDTLSAVQCYRGLGATIDTSCAETWKIIGTSGKIRPEGRTINVGNSGTTLRVAMGSAALVDKGLTV